jgi:DNA processing protein
MNEHQLWPEAPHYPPLLRHVVEPPAPLFARGQLVETRDEWDDAPAVAIVGARDATAYGLGVARDLGRELARRGVVVVSGLAVGIDGAAHRGALDAGGRTIAVVGAGTDVVYPRQHARLRAEILSSGAVVSEMPAGTPPMPHHFPRRNRLISGLCLGVVVVEATLRSGSLSTARHALEQGREVMAVPGAVVAPRSRGPHALLKEGAKLVETVDDIVAEIPVARLAACGVAGPALSPQCVAILRCIAAGDASADQIAAREGREVAEIWRDLLGLELIGAIVRQSGGRFGLSSPIADTSPATQDRRVDGPAKGS